jgi:hypothetical protein
MLENPFTTIGTTAALAMPVVGPVVGLAMAGQMSYHIAQYGWQKAAELSLSPEDRARAEADPERISRRGGGGAGGDAGPRAADPRRREGIPRARREHRHDGGGRRWGEGAAAAGVLARRARSIRV